MKREPMSYSPQLALSRQLRAKRGAAKIRAEAARAIPFGTQRDCRKENTSARKEIHGIMFEKRPCKGWDGQWVLVDGKGVSIRRLKVRDPWSLFLKGQLTDTITTTSLPEFIRSNEAAIRQGLNGYAIGP